MIYKIIKLFMRINQGDSTAADSTLIACKFVLVKCFTNYLALSYREIRQLFSIKNTLKRLFAE